MQHTVDDVLVIHKGKLVKSGSLAEITEGQTLEEAFLRLTGGAA